MKQPYIFFMQKEIDSAVCKMSTISFKVLMYYFPPSLDVILAVFKMN